MFGTAHHQRLRRRSTRSLWRTSCLRKVPPVLCLNIRDHSECLRAVARYLPRKHWPRTWFHCSNSCKKATTANMGGRDMSAFPREGKEGISLTESGGEPACSLHPANPQAWAPHSALLGDREGEAGSHTAPRPGPCAPSSPCRPRPRLRRRCAPLGHGERAQAPIFTTRGATGSRFYAPQRRVADASRHTPHSARALSHRVCGAARGWRAHGHTKHAQTPIS